MFHYLEKKSRRFILLLFCFIKVIEEENLQQNCADIGTYLLNKLATLRDEFPIVGDVRGKGLMIGIEMVANKVIIAQHHLSAQNFFTLSCVGFVFIFMAQYCIQSKVLAPILCFFYLYSIHPFGVLFFFVFLFFLPFLLSFFFIFLCFLWYCFYCLVIIGHCAIIEVDTLALTRHSKKKSESWCPPYSKMCAT